MEHIVKIKSITNATHDVLRIVTEKPESYSFVSGQATEVSINKKVWSAKKNPFTYTSLPTDNFLEFTIRTYPQHRNVTNKLLKLVIGDELILHDVFGTISYKGEGVFIAGGAGVTPFISIIRYLKSRKEIGNNKLVFANKTKADIINEQEFKDLLGKNFINILSEEKVHGYDQGFITESFLIENKIDKAGNYYLCGPPPMMDAIEKLLTQLQIQKKAIIKETF